MTITDADLQHALRNVAHLDPGQKARVLQLLEERDKLKRLDTAREHFIPFVKEVWPDFIPGAHHNLVGAAFEKIINGTSKRLIINMAPRHRLALDTPVATTEGWKTIASVVPGDHVFAPSGAPVLVTGKSEVYWEPLYRAETTDGQFVECDGEHLWSVRWGSNERPFRTMSTEEILRKSTQETWGAYNLPKLPRVQPVEYPERNLLIPPYVLGAWLGDGASDSGTMAAHPNDAPAIRARFERSGIQTTDTKWDMTFGTLTLRVKLRELGVLNNKHIPEEYLTAHPIQRLALLQGLMDTDGSVSVQGKCVFGNSNRRLIENVLELVHSFGLKARITERQGVYRGKNVQMAYRVSFKMAGAAHLPRKAARCRNITGNESRSLKITETGRKGFVQCLEVDSPDGLFLAGRAYIPTHNTKSELASVMFPAWFLGKRPRKKIIQVSNTEALASGFGRRVRNMIDGSVNETEELTKGTNYTEIFPSIKLAADSKAAAGWHTNYGGEYFAIGVNGRVTGKGADLAIVDDPHSEQEAKQAEYSPAIFDSVYDWYTSGIRQRLQPGGAIVIVMTRWSKRDLTGRLIDKMQQREAGESGDRWEVIELPALLDEGLVTERPMWPGFWSLKELKDTREEIGPLKFRAQYQQDPVSEQSAILKRDYWRIWGEDREVDLKEGHSSCPGPQHAAAWNNLDPPACDFILQSWDCAASKNDRSHPSAFTEWGIFKAEDPKTGKTINNLILLSAYKARMEFPELKQKAKQFYEESQPDSLLIENKSAGMQLLQEFRAMGIPAEDFTGSSRGSRAIPNDKIARANLIADIFASGYVWMPDRRFAEDVRVQCAEFPNGMEDDYVDSTVQALLRFRAGNLVRTENDEEEERDAPRARRKRYY